MEALNVAPTQFAITLPAFPRWKISAMLTDHKAIICFDFDGTFISPEPDEHAMDELLAMVSDLRGRGAAWVINTGRSLFQTLEGLADHGIRSLPDFIVAREGEIYMPGKYNRWLDVGRWNASRTKDHKKLYKSHAKFFKEVQRWLHTETKAHWISETQEPAGIISSTAEEMEEICSWLDSKMIAHKDLVYQRNSIYLRFTHCDYSKGTALRELSTVLGIVPDHVFVAGDNHNDMSMLNIEVAHCLACPSNSIPIVQEVVKHQNGHVAPRPSTLGCVDALSYYFYD